MKKFSESKIARKFLHSTGQKCIIETSPSDKIWGIGRKSSIPLDSDNDPTLNHNTMYNGKNYLGRTIMRVRENFTSPPPQGIKHYIGDTFHQWMNQTNRGELYPMFFF